MSSLTTGQQVGEFFKQYGELVEVNAYTIILMALLFLLDMELFAPLLASWRIEICHL